MSDDPTTGSVEDSAGLRRYLTGGLLWSGGGLVAAVVLAFAVNALAARVLDVDDVAAFLLLVSIGQSLGSAAELGLPPLVVRELAEDRHGSGPRFLGHAWVLVAAAALVVTIAGAGLGRTVFDRLTQQPAVVAVSPWVGALIAVRALERLAGDSFRGVKDIPRAVLTGNVGTQFGAALLLGAMALVGSRDPHLAIGAYVAGGAATALVAVVGLRAVAPVRPWVGVSDQAATMLTESWPLIGHRMAFLLLQQAPLWVVGATLAASPTADYGIAQRLVTTVGFPLLIVNQIVPPLISTDAVARRARLERTLRTTATLAALPAAVVLGTLVVAGEPVLRIGFGPAFVGAAAPLAILSVGQMCNVVAGSCGPVLTQTGHQRTLWWITSTSTVSTLVAAAVIAPVHGVVGVAWAATAGLAAQNLGMVVAVRRTVGIRTWVGVSGLRDLGGEIRRLAATRGGTGD